LYFSNIYPTSINNSYTKGLFKNGRKKYLMQKIIPHIKEVNIIKIKRFYYEY